MSLECSRIGDVFVGICHCKHKKKTAGILITGASRTTCENPADCRVGDIGISICKHPTIIVTGSGTVTIENQADARVSDVVAGCVTGIVVTGASRTTNTN